MKKLTGDEPEETPLTTENEAVEEKEEKTTTAHEGNSAVAETIVPYSNNSTASEISEFLKTQTQENAPTNYVATPIVTENNANVTPSTPIQQDWQQLTHQRTEAERNVGLAAYQLPPTFDIFVGDNQPTAQYGILGVTAEYEQKIAMDLNGTNTISLFGVQGAGKSYSIGTVTEMVLKQFPQVNVLQTPLAGVIFHYSESEDYKPEFTSMIMPNQRSNEVQKLKQIYGADPDRVKDIVLLVPKDKLQQRRAEYPNIAVVPISFASSELGIKEWKFLMGVSNNSALYIKQFNNLMRTIRSDLTLQSLQEAIESTKLMSPAQKELARVRLSLAKEFINDELELKNLVRPGRLLLVDLRDELIEKEDALSIFVIMLNIFASAKREDGSAFNKFIVFDEAHKYMGNKNLTNVIVETIREMRHKGVTLMIASQDPPSLPTEIIELSSMLIAHRFNSPQWLKHIQKSVTHLAHLNPEDMANLKQGEAFLWTNKASDASFTQRAMKIRTRPRITQHGGATLTAGQTH
ncbi:MAG: ATP-binding protein [Cytophagales bacterium]|nr:MAG: ATP-binding protein [Cytophagales bacterium]